MTSMAVIPGAMRPGLRLMRQLPVLALVLALAAAVMLALGPLGWRAGWWHYRVGFSTLMPWAAYCGLAAIAVALAALVIGRRVNTARQMVIGIVALTIGAAVAYAAPTRRSTTSRPIGTTRRNSARSCRCARPKRPIRSLMRAPRSVTSSAAPTLTSPR